MATTAAPRKRPRLRRRTLIWGGVILALILVCAVAGVLIRSALSSAAAAGATGWQTEIVKTGPIDASVSATGSVEPRAQADLRFAVNGIVTAVLVKPGDKVQAGQPLARIDAA